MTKKDIRNKIIALYIGEPPPWAPYSYPPLECILPDTDKKIYKDWKNNYDEQMVRWKKEMKKYRLKRANELRELKIFVNHTHGNLTKSQIHKIVFGE